MYVSHLIELRPGLLVAWVLLHLQSSSPADKFHLITAFDTELQSTRVLWQSANHFDDKIEKPYFIPIKGREWFIHPDETGLCVRSAIDGTVVSRLRKPSGLEINQHQDQFIAATSEIILILDENDTEFEGVGNDLTSIEQYAYTLPEFALRTADIVNSVKAEAENPDNWWTYNRFFCQVTALHALEVTAEGRSQFALGHAAYVNFVEL
jgi:hypothetical protein